MRNRLFVIVVVFLIAVSGAGWAIENPAVGSWGRLGIYPPQSNRSGLVRSPNPIDTSGNLVITGNVRGGRHFRGVVPYRASSYFGAVTGSSSLDSFLRYSAGSEDFGRYTGASKPFYSRSRTVTTTRSGQAGVIRPPTMRIGGYISGSDVRPLLQQRLGGQTLSYLGTGMLGSGFVDADFGALRAQKSAFGIPAGSRGIEPYRPMSMTPWEMERAILAEAGARFYRDKDKIPARREAQIQQETWLDQFPSGLSKGLASEDESFQLPSSRIGERDVPKPFELRGLKEQPGEGKEQKSQLDVQGQIKQRLEELQRDYEQLAAAEAAKEVSDGEKGLRKKDIGFVGSVSGKGRKVEGGEDSEEKDSLLDGFSGLPKTIGDVWSSSGFAGSVSAQNGEVGASRSAVDLSVRAKAILGPHKSFASFWNEKFNQHMRAGENYLKRGKYYRAADAYTVALIYKPEEPLAQIGKSHALLAAGEYMSSALFLSRALMATSEGDKTGEYGVQQFLALNSKFFSFIDRDKLEKRVVDVEQWQQRSDSAELQFLLGYIYYQMGRLEAAREAIDGAYRKMPDVPAIIVLRKVICSKKQSDRDKNP